MEEEDTAAEAAEVFTEEAVAADFMEVAEEGFTVVEVLAEEAAATLVSAADIRMAAVIVADMGAEDIVAATTVAAVTTAVAAAMDGAGGATAGAAEVGVTEEVGAEAGVGDLDMVGRIGDMAGDIRMATTATRITRPTVILIRTRRMGLRMTT